ncbi:MAG: glycosyltransferase family 2 protein [Prevotella sp.]|nr:glycosyltransferase family 2 protein [Prevotella sp.]
MGKVAILLATYNGEAYLREQIDSLYQQTFKDWTVYVHDDGSKDQTCAILKEYAAKHDNFIILDYPSQHGAKNNFLSLLQAVQADYYLFCDQDDKWCPDKIEKQMATMKEAEQAHPGKPVLVFSDLFIVDSELHQMGTTLWQQECIHPEYLTTFDEAGALEFVTGCTMLFNQQAKNAVVFPADKAVMHDSWITLCVLRSGGIVEAIHEPLVYYRQHGNNEIGVNHWAQYSRIKRLLNIKKSIVANYRHYRMLSALGYGSLFKYLRYKNLYRQKRQRHLQNINTGQ